MTPDPTVLRPDVLIIGGGPAGLTAAAALARGRATEVLVLDREAQAGGIPRHSAHTGYGLRDLHRVLTGPSYARRLVSLAAAAGARIRTEAMVTGWDGGGGALVTTPDGRFVVEARATILATGARERPRAARLVPGDRPAGVLTTGQLQNLVHRHGAVPGRRAVVVGAELVGWSAVLTLREAGCSTVLMTTEHATPESYAVVTAAGRIGLRTPIATGSRVVRIIGTGRVRAVELADVRTGRRRTVECDTVVFTGGWIPDHELARLAGIEIDPGTLGPSVDTALRTSRPGVFAAGNLVHPVDTADIAALDGAHVAAQVRRWLDGTRAVEPGVRLLVDKPLRWIAPNLVRAGDPAPARNRLLLWTDELIRRPEVVVRQAGVELARRRLPWPASPGRVCRVPSGILDRLDSTGGDVRLSVRGTPRT